MVLRDLLTLPARLGRLGIMKPILTSGRQFSASIRITGPLPSVTVNQVSEYPLHAFYEQMELKNCIKNKNRKWSLNEADSFKPQHQFDLGQSMEFAR